MKFDDVGMEDADLSDTTLLISKDVRGAHYVSTGLMYLYLYRHHTVNIHTSIHDLSPLLLLPEPMLPLTRLLV
jgi:hypothetical protein